MTDNSPSQPRSVLAVIGVLVLVAAVVAGAILLSQRQDERSATPDRGTATPTDTSTPGQAPTPATGPASVGDDLGDLPTIDASDFPEDTPPAGLPTSFPSDIFPAEFPTDAAGWEAWESEQMEQP